LIKGQIS